MNGPLGQGALKTLCRQGLGRRGGDDLGAGGQGLGEDRFERAPARSAQYKTLNLPTFVADCRENGVSAVEPDCAVCFLAAAP